MLSEHLLDFIWDPDKELTLHALAVGILGRMKSAAPVSHIPQDVIKDLGGDSAVFSNGFTYSGHPVAAAAGIKNLEIMQREELFEQARETGPYMQQQLQTLRAIPIVTDVRGLGLMACVECEVEEGSRDLEMDLELGNRIDKHCQAMGLIVRPIINMCVMSPPLTITREQIDEMVAILRKGILLAMQDIENEKSAAAASDSRHPSPAA